MVLIFRTIGTLSLDRVEANAVGRVLEGIDFCHGSVQCSGLL